ncbi:hypothetical protein DP939_40650 [Spongiactinospora rosea]|uniref:DUF397 domain-containing protein n=1 Tax=Spongiactinospora rosea TaxID=2248750 RepID=A0A366LLW0_9ACTN|nr:hypothetical protein DP939_40650 [Spongiactinospora rosea]
MRVPGGTRGDAARHAGVRPPAGVRVEHGRLGESDPRYDRQSRLTVWERAHVNEFAREGWVKSSYSGGGNCVEVSVASGAVGVRDSKRPGGGELRFTPAEWGAFVAGVKSGEYDLGR